MFNFNQLIEFRDRPVATLCGSKVLWECDLLKLWSNVITLEAASSDEELDEDLQNQMWDGGKAVLSQAEYQCAVPGSYHYLRGGDKSGPYWQESHVTRP